jgi:glucose-6-phosphate 1-dehydrogenase
MSTTRSDALVFFGATGDLAYKKIPSLQAMAKHGRLDVPVIGVARAGWNLEQFRARFPLTDDSIRTSHRLKSASRSIILAASGCKSRNL